MMRDDDDDDEVMMIDDDDEECSLQDTPPTLLQPRPGLSSLLRLVSDSPGRRTTSSVSSRLCLAWGML